MGQEASLKMTLCVRWLSEFIPKPGELNALSMAGVAALLRHPALCSLGAYSFEAVGLKRLRLLQSP